MVSYVCRILERLGVCPRDPVGAFWERDTAFMKLYASIRDHTVVSVDRCYKLYQMAKFTNHIPGAIAELGIYKGGIAKMILQVTPSEKKYFLFDTFSGIPKDHASEKERESIRHISDFSDVTLEDVQRYLASDRCVFKQGCFQTLHTDWRMSGFRSCTLMQTSTNRRRMGSPSFTHASIMAEYWLLTTMGRVPGRG